MIVHLKTVHILAQAKRKEITTRTIGSMSQKAPAKSQAACSFRGGNNNLSGYLGYKGTVRRAFFCVRVFLNDLSNDATTF